MGDLIRCRLCRTELDVDDAERRSLERAGRLTKLDATGLWRGGNYVNAQYLLDECESCKVDDVAEGAPVDLQMARIREHIDTMRSRGVSLDEAISHAVSRQMIRAEVRRWPLFVAHYTGLTQELGLG